MERVGVRVQYIDAPKAKEAATSRLRWTRPPRAVEPDHDALPPVGARADRIRHAIEHDIPAAESTRSRPRVRPPARPAAIEPAPAHKPATAPPPVRTSKPARKAAPMRASMLARRRLAQLKHVVAFVRTPAFTRKSDFHQAALLDEIERAYRTLRLTPSTEYDATHPVLASARRLLVRAGRKPA